MTRWLDLRALREDILVASWVVESLRHYATREPGEGFIARAVVAHGRLRFREARSVLDALYAVRALHRGRLHRTRWRNRRGVVVSVRPSPAMLAHERERLRMVLAKYRIKGVDGGAAT